MSAQIIPIRIYLDAEASRRDARRFNEELARTGAAARTASRGTRSANEELRRTRRAAREANQGLGGADRGFRNLAASAASARAALLGSAIAIGTLGAIRAAEGIANAADSVELLTQRFQTLTGEIGGFERVAEISNRLGVSFEQVGDVFARFAIGTRELSLTQQQLGDLTETVFALGRIGGTSIQEVAAATIQLGQGFASGRLQGEELRSVLENIPLVAQRIADSLGVGIGELRALGAEGVLTAEVISGALLDSAEDVRREFEGLPRTLQQSRAELRNTWRLLLAELGTALRASEIFQFFDQFLRESIEAAAAQLRGVTGTERELQEARVSTLLAEQLETEVKIRNLKREGATATGAEVQQLQALFGIQQRRTDEALRELEAIDRRAQLAKDIERAESIRSREPVPIAEPQTITIVGKSTREEEEADRRAAERRARREQQEREALEREARAVIDSLRTREQVIADERDRAFAVAEELRQRDAAFAQLARETEIAAAIRHEQELTRIEQEEADKRLAKKQADAQEQIRIQQETQQAIAQASVGFAALASALGGQSSQLAKAAAIADATIQTYVAANRALNDPSSLPTPTRYVLAAGIIAAGLANVARIRSTPIPRASGGSVQGGQVYRVAEMQPEIYRTEGGQTFLIPKVGGEVQPLAASGGPNGLQVVMRNEGPPTRIAASRQIDSRTLEIFLEAADQQSRSAFEDELKHGYGSYAATLRSHTTLRRRVI